MQRRAFIDANVPMYAVDREHPLREPCRLILQRIVDGEGNRYPQMAPRDWLHLAVMLNNGITDIISADRHFDDIEGITRLDPREFVQAQP